MFAGFHLSSEGYQVDQSITDTISQFPKPTKLVYQLSSSICTVATLLTPLRPLLHTKNDFLWSNNHEKAFTQRRMHSRALQYQYCPFLIPTDLLTCVLMQADKDLLLSYSSKAMTSLTWNLRSHFLESRYAIIELEMLAVCWAGNAI